MRRRRPATVPPMSLLPLASANGWAAGINAYAVVFIDPDQVTVHFHDYLDRRTLTRAGDHYEYIR